MKINHVQLADGTFSLCSHMAFPLDGSGSPERVDSSLPSFMFLYYLKASTKQKCLYYSLKQRISNTLKVGGENRFRNWILLNPLQMHLFSKLFDIYYMLGTAMVWLLVSLQNLYVEILIPDSIRRRGLWEMLRIQGWSPHDGISALIK